MHSVDGSSGAGLEVLLGIGTRRLAAHSNNLDSAAVTVAAAVPRTPRPAHALLARREHPTRCSGDPTGPANPNAAGTVMLRSATPHHPNRGPNMSQPCRCHASSTSCSRGRIPKGRRAPTDRESLPGI